jgi:hypothetical protein
MGKSKSLNPADAQRKKERAKEIKKNKANRTALRADKLFTSPEALRAELEKWRRLRPGQTGEDGEKLDPVSIANRIKKLEEAHDALLRQRRVRARGGDAVLCAGGQGGVGGWARGGARVCGERNPRNADARARGGEAARAAQCADARRACVCVSVCVRAVTCACARLRRRTRRRLRRPRRRGRKSFMRCRSSCVRTRRRAAPAARAGTARRTRCTTTRS